MKKRFTTILLILWVCLKVSAQEQLTWIKTIPSADSSPEYLASINKKCLFVANGNELFSSDGTEAGTILLKKRIIIEQNKKQIASDSTHLYFLVSDSLSNSVEIWRTDGTATATTKIAEIADSSSVTDLSYYLLKSDNYYYFISNVKFTQRYIIAQFDKNFQLLVKESSVGKYGWNPLVFKDLLFIKTKLFRTKDNTAFNDFSFNFYPDVNQYYSIGDYLYIKAYDTNKLYEYNGSSTKEFTLPFETINNQNVIYRFFIENNQLHLLYILKSGTSSFTLREFLVHRDSGIFEEILVFNPLKGFSDIWQQEKSTYLATNEGATTIIHKIAHDLNHQITSHRFTANQFYSLIINNGKNLFILQKDRFTPDGILYNADTETLISLPTGIVFKQFLSEIRPDVWLLSASQRDTGEELYILDVATGQVSLLKDMNTAGTGIQKLYQLNDQTLIWSAPEKNGTIVYKSDGTKDGTLPVKTLTTAKSLSYYSPYDTSILSDSSLIISNYRDDTYDDVLCQGCRPSRKPLVYKTDGTAAGTQKLFESDRELSYYFNDKIGDDFFHMFIPTRNFNKLEVWKNSNASAEAVLVDSLKSMYTFESTDPKGENLVYSYFGNGRSYGVINIPSGQVIKEQGNGLDYIGSVNEKVLFQEITAIQSNIYVVESKEMVKLLTMNSYSADKEYSALFGEPMERVFAGDADNIYVTDGTLANTKKIPLLFKEFKLSGVKRFGGNYYFQFSRTVNGIIEYKVQIYKNGVAAESDISPEIFQMNEAKIGNTTYLYKYGFSNGVGLDIFRLDNGVLSKVTFIGSDYEYFPVRVFKNAIIANPNGKVIIWSPEGTYEIGQGIIGEVMEFGNKYVFVTKVINKPSLYATDGKSAGAQLLGEFQALDLYRKPIIGNKIYFAAATVEKGMEPWETDGTPEGTKMIADLWKGTQGSNPTDFMEVNEIPVCLASTPEAGRQLFTLLPKLDSPVLAVPNTQACEGDTITLTASKGYDSYKWITDDGEELTTTDNKLNITKSGSYKVVVSRGKASSYPSNIVNINFTPLPAKPVIKQENSQLNVSSTGQLQWYLNGSVITGATTNTLTYNGVGEYAVKATEKGCSILSDKLMVSITSLEQELTTTVYPNPASNRLIINVNPNQPTNLIMTDVSGKIVLQKMLREAVNEINIKGFATGVYLLKVDGITRKIIIE